MTCVWRAETAACRNARLQQNLPVTDAPEPAECQSSCRNLAYTDRDITTARQQVTFLRQAATDPLASHPVRDRAASKAVRLQAIIDQHQATRPSDPKETADGRQAT
jgi:hypothetical protein